MTSRRSRLKAVTNLPVRRKGLTVQGNTADTISVGNLTSENVLSRFPKSDEILATAFNSNSNHVTEKILYATSNKDEKNNSLKKIDCTGFQTNENFGNENDISKRTESDDSGLVKKNSDLTKTCNLLSCKADGNNSSVSKNDQNNKVNLTSSSKEEKAQLETLENTNANEIFLQQSYTINYNTSDNNSFNSNVEDGLKCYTVLTPQSVALTSLTESTISPIVSYINNFIDSNVDDVSASQEFEGVQIYTEVEPVELYNYSEIHINSESLIETESFDPVLTTLTNYNCENEVNCINSDVSKLKNNSDNSFSKPVKKISSVKSNFNGNEEQQKSSLLEIKDSNVVERRISSAPLKVSSDFNSYKSTSTIRRKRVKYNDFTKKLADAKREFQRKYEKSKPDRSSLKMIDLIFYNPSSNPMESKVKFEKKDILEPFSELVNDLLLEEKVDEPEILDCNSRSNISDINESEGTNKMPVPQVKIGLDGEIIIDEKSLIIETTDAKKGREGLQNSVPVIEEKGSKVSYYRGKCKKSRDWADFETKRFYKALNTIGPDFTLMQKYFPKRSRLELKNKFKREERFNRTLIDKALNNPSEFDMTRLEKDLAIEKEAEEGIGMRFCRIVKRTTKKPKVKSSFLSREMIESDGEPANNQLKSFEIDSKRLSENERSKKEKEFDFVFQKLLMKESEKSDVILSKISPSIDALLDSDSDIT